MYKDHKDDQVLKIKIHENGKTPKYYNSGFQLFSGEEVTIEPQEFKLVSTDISIQLITKKKVDITIEMTKNLLKKNLYIINHPGTIDIDYRGILKVILWNFGDTTVDIKKEEIIGQLGIYKRKYVKIEEEDKKEEQQYERQ